MIAVSLVGACDSTSDDRDAGNDGGSPPMMDGAIPDGGVVTTTLLRGRVLALDAAQAISGAEVIGSLASTTTSSDGSFQLEIPAGGARTTVAVRAAGYADGVLAVRAVAGADAWAELHLVPVSVTQQFDVAAGAELAAAGARVRVPPGALVDAAGTPVTGMVTMSVSVLDPLTPRGLDAFPGTFEATQGGEDVLLESVSLMDVTATQGGERLQIAPGMNLELEWPSNGTPDSDTAIPIWSLDPLTGVWRAEGQAVRVSTASGVVFRANVSHMSWWNLDYASTTITCVRGCVTFGGNPVRNAALRVSSLTSGTGGRGFTGENGCFAEDVRGGLPYSIVASGIAGVSEAQVFTPPPVAMRAASNPGACFDVGTLELVARDPSSSCADGLYDCAGACVDLRTDASSCGSCGTRCGVEGGLFGSSCIEGVCECASGRTNCSGSCVDVETHRNHCGSCGTVCPTGQACSAGSCQPIACASGLTLCGNECVDLDADERHCGTCTTYCQSDWGQVCDAGTCRCPGGTADCDGIGSCADLQSSEDDCGTCNNACSATQTCSSGVCQEIVCGGGQTLCNRNCVDTQTDPSNCGSCGSSCNIESGATCNAGTCGCPTGLSACGSTCQDLSSSHSNCGACGNACTSTQECVSGSCREIVCAGGQTLCSGACVDTTTSTQHCGACNDYCSILCIGGTCTCGAAQRACPGGGKPGFYTCVTDGSTCAAGNVSGPCANLEGDYAMAGTCPGTTMTIEQRDCGAYVTVSGACYGRPAAVSGSTVTFGCGATSCTGTLSGTNISVSCGGGACTSSGTRQ